uniref:Uncharacterized protein n=1 Tax=Panagrolaimus davidi TaxID=227884 RepID=A0A914PT22_9BILA
MVWFAEEVVTSDMLTENYLNRLRTFRLDSDSQHTVEEIMAHTSSASMELSTPMEGSVTASVMMFLRPKKLINMISNGLCQVSIQTECSLFYLLQNHYCEYRRTPNGIVLSPIQMSRWLVILCDKINLPSPDKYSTQRVISFMRQLAEQNGIYRTSDHQWIALERIQFAAVCNPP